MAYGVKAMGTALKRNLKKIGNDTKRMATPLFFVLRYKIIARLSIGTQSAIAQSVYLVPILLSFMCAAISIGTVRMFKLFGDVSLAENGNVATNTDDAISVLLGLIFSTELGVRLFLMADARSKIVLATGMMPPTSLKFFRDLVFRFSDEQEADNFFPLELAKKDLVKASAYEIMGEQYASSFVSAIYSAASLHSVKAELHLRWVLLDLTIIYHTLVRAYVMSVTVSDDSTVFTDSFSHSFMHFFVVMLLFCTSDGIDRLFTRQFISDKRLAVPPVYVYNCLELLMEREEGEITAKTKYPPT